MTTTRSYVTCTDSMCHAGNGGAASASSSDVMSASPFQDLTRDNAELIVGFIYYYIIIVIIKSFSPISTCPFLWTNHQLNSLRWFELSWARLKAGELVWGAMQFKYDLRTINDPGIKTHSIQLSRRWIKSLRWAEQPEWWGWPGMFWLGTCHTNYWRWGLAMDRVRKNGLFQ